MIPLQAGVDLGAIAMKWYSEFPKSPTSLKTHPQIVSYHIKTLVVRVSYPSAEKQSVYSRAQDDWVTGHRLGGWGFLTPLQRNNRCILLPQPTGPQETGRGVSYPSTEKQSVYFTVLADWATRGEVPIYQFFLLLFLVV